MHVSSSAGRLEATGPTSCAMLVWLPRGATSPFTLDVKHFFAANRGLKTII
jgi:hypothetical protein